MKHGTSTAYITHRCRCAVCKTEHARRQKRYRLDRLRGVERLVDAQPVRDHVEQLLAAGMSFRAITLAAGWKSRNSLAQSISRARVTQFTRDRILAVSVDSDERRDRYVDATGARRRLQALAVIGWPSRGLATRLGHLDHGTCLNIQSGRNATARQRTVNAIERLYDELWDKPGPSVRAASTAKRKGWAPPLAWDDELLDDPQGSPQGAGFLERARSLNGEMVEDFLDTWNHHQGDCWLAAHRLGVSHEALVQQLRRARRAGMGIEFQANQNRKASA